MGSVWIKVEVFNHEKFIGSFYTNAITKAEIIKEIDEKYGKGNWTKYNID